ncbi:conserved hypothetical protein [Sphingomonas sp. EC-HK361]|uniref:SRPBCC domain-containing protein n=1 Tax=Sphingomonas sp. EC-HK361 TaxID=2038397 RepID=UPI0012542553|nr:SRPBCC domain-containing protein [Sphingomonas sp. EC-HK361]VVT13281.1 conserved hypothetical protein [Sphingomonas sp. EC-HK361]
MSAFADELVVERTIDAPRAVVWRVMTEHLPEWWCPEPWKAEPVALEWKSGGRFAIAMRGPGGEEHGGDGMLLEVVPETRLVFTNALGENWAPQVPQPVAIVGRIEIADTGDGRTAYRASARHWSEADTKAHAEMGFAEGWGICADQLAALATRMAEARDA